MVQLNAHAKIKRHVSKCRSRRASANGRYLRKMIVFLVNASAKEDNQSAMTKTRLLASSCRQSKSANGFQHQVNVEHHQGNAWVNLNALANLAERATACECKRASVDISLPQRMK
jgi:hypothetical protein